MRFFNALCREELPMVGFFRDRVWTEATPGGLRWSIHQNIPDSLGTRMPGWSEGFTSTGLKGVPLPPRLFSLFVFCSVLVFQDRVSLYNSPSCPGTRSVDKTGLEFTEVCRQLPPEC